MTIDDQFDSSNALQEEKTEPRQGKCLCPCHKGAIVIHPLPCCVPCPYCGRMIARGMLGDHEPHCSKKET